MSEVARPKFYKPGPRRKQVADVISWPVIPRRNYTGPVEDDDTAIEAKQRLDLIEHALTEITFSATFLVNLGQLDALELRIAAIVTKIHHAREQTP